MHGVQPNANAAPMTGGPNNPSRDARLDSTRRSLSIGINHVGVQIAVIAMKRPIAMMTQPAMTVKIDWLRNEDRLVAVAPRATKTAVNPRTNSAVRPTTRFIDTLPSDNSCMSYPDISEMYPGRSGRTQGDRKEAAPANSAAIRDTSKGSYLVRRALFQR